MNIYKTFYLVAYLDVKILTPLYVPFSSISCVKYWCAQILTFKFKYLKLILLYFLLQSYFSRGGAKFIGMIVSPYNRNNPLPYSQITCLVISDEISPDGSYRKFSTKTILSYFCLLLLQIKDFTSKQNYLNGKFVPSPGGLLFAYHVVQLPSSLLRYPSRFKSPLYYHDHWAE